MKVKVAELKARLSAYLRRVRETGEPIEVMLRDETVAYLTSARSRETPKAAEAREELQELQGQLAELGITLAPETAPLTVPAVATPVLAGDGQRDVSTMEQMRAEKDW